MKNLDFKDTDKKFKVKIYGIECEINKLELEKVDTNKIGENSNIIELLNKILGKEKIEELNKKRNENNYKNIDDSVGLAILFHIVSEYVNYSIKPINNIFSEVDNMNNRFNKYNNRRRNYRRY
jgi:hypothetical protein